jgi:hypothetical protein
MMGLALTRSNELNGALVLHSYTTSCDDFRFGLMAKVEPRKGRLAKTIP